MGSGDGLAERRNCAERSSGEKVLHEVLSLLDLRNNDVLHTVPQTASLHAVMFGTEGWHIDYAAYFTPITLLHNIVL